MIFDGIVCRREQSNTKYVVYNGWKVRMLYGRYVYGYGVKQVAKNAHDFVIGKAGFVL